MIKRYITLVLFVLVAIQITHAQEIFNVQNLTPSALLPTGKWEIKSFNSNYTQTAHFDQDGKRTDNAGGTLYFDDGTARENVDKLRDTFFSSVNQVNYGLSPKVNVGLQFWVNSGALSSSKDSRFSSISFNQTAHTRTALSYIGANIKLIPIESVSNFSFQSVFLIPIGKDLQSNFTPQPFLNWDAYTWTNQFFLDISLHEKWLLFLNLDLVWGIGRNKEVKALQGSRFTIPAKAFINFFATDKLTLLLQAEYNHIWHGFGDEATRQVQGAYYFQSGPSIKYQLIPSKIEGEISYNYFLAGNNGQGAGNSLNLGIRVLL